MLLSKPTAVIFDWDNTLVDTWPTIHRALHDTFVAYGKRPWTLEEVKEKVGKSLRDAFPDLFGAQWERAGELYQQGYRTYRPESLKPLPGAEELLDALREAALPLLVVSNKKSHNLREEVAHLGWEGYFGAVVGADDAAFDKPHAAPALLALERAKLKPEPSVWFIGDTVTDLECAQNCGAAPVLYGERVPTPDPDGLLRYGGFPVLRHAPDHAALHALLRDHGVF